MTDTNKTPHKTDFIRHIIDADLASGQYSGGLVFRFPPEPNGYLHVGHAKSICLNFGLAKNYVGTCHLRFDDTNPAKEEVEYVESIKRDVEWLGGQWGEHLYYASDYFDQFYELAVKLIKNGDAYVDSLSAEKIREFRGTLKEPGKNSPDRDRSIEDSLNLFGRMKAGEFSEGAYCLRARIDMSSGNVNMRDPVLYRILHHAHDRTGGKWCIYPMYDFAHALSDAIEGITHSLCTLEFQDHRPLYNWCVEKCEMQKRPKQIEFSRLNLNYTITSKRKLKDLVEGGHVAAWDDPRMPTISGLRRRGYTAAGIREFCNQVGISKQDSVIDVSVLEDCIRNDLNKIAPRRNVVLNPVKLTIQNYPEGEVEWLSISNHPQDESFGKRDVAFCRNLYIDRDDFMFDAPKEFFRLAPDQEVRLLNAYAVRCSEVVTDEAGNLVELICTYDKDTLGGKKPADGRKIKGVIHWVSADHAVDATVRIYDRLFSHESPGSLENVVDALNPNSLEIKNAKCEPSLKQASVIEHFQFNRVGYFVTDLRDYQPGNELVFNQVVPLRSSTGS
jgi:glutaminyl-tRNA synthetase